MALREKILEEDRRKKRVADAFNRQPIPDVVPLAELAQMAEESRATGSGFSPDDSQRLMRIERLLVELLKQSKI